MRRISVIVAVALAAVVLAACGTEEDSQGQPGGFGAPPTATPTQEALTAQQIVDMTRSALEGVTSYRSHGVMASKLNGEQTESATVELTWAAPDDYHFVIEDSVNGRFEALAAGGRRFSTDVFTGEGDTWIEYESPDGVTTGEVVDTAMIRPPSWLDLDDIVLARTDLIDGAAVYVLEGKLRQPDGSTGEFMPPVETSTLEKSRIYVSQDDFRVVRMEHISETTFQEGDPAGGGTPVTSSSSDTFTLDISAYNEPVTIEPPEEYESVDDLGPIPDNFPPGGYAPGASLESVPPFYLEARVRSDVPGDMEDLIVRWWHEPQGLWRVEFEAQSPAEYSGMETLVADGQAVWMYDVESDTYFQDEQLAEFGLTPSEFIGISIGPVPFGSLDTWAEMLSYGYDNGVSPEVVGEETVLGRTVQVVDLDGAGKAWLDAERGMILKYVSGPEDPYELVAEVTKLDYDTELPAETFQFTPPPGAVEITGNSETWLE